MADELLLPSVDLRAGSPRSWPIGSDLHGVAHITGGGLAGQRAADAAARRRRGDRTVDAGRCRAIFGEIARLGGVVDAEMERVFNLGIGMVVAVGARGRRDACNVLRAAGHDAAVVGEVVPGSGQLTLVP